VKKNEEETNHAEQNAIGHASSMIEAYHLHQKFEEDRHCGPLDYDGSEVNDDDELRERVQEEALSVQVRGPFHDPGAKVEDDEFEILLSTGGPALRIIGDLGRFNQPERPKMEWQDWGTAWTFFYSDLEDYEDALTWFCSCFYFGE